MKEAFTPRTCIPVPKIEEDCYDWYARHREKVAAAQSGKFDLILVGDSITHFWQGESGHDYGSEVWRQYFSHYRVLNLGFGFDRAQNVLWRIRHGELEGQSPQLLVLNIGTNHFSVTSGYDGDSPETAAAGCIAVIRELRTLLPQTRLVVMGVFPRGSVAEGFRQKIAALNAAVRRFVEPLPLADFLDISEKLTFPDGSLREELYADKCCHLNAAGYRIWGEALLPYLAELPVYDGGTSAGSVS